MISTVFTRVQGLMFGLLALLLMLMPMGGAQAQVTAFKQAVAEAVALDADLAQFYRDRDYAPFWTAQDDESTARRAALMQALEGAASHGLPAQAYDADGLMQLMAQARSSRDLGFIEGALSRTYLSYARDLQTGVLVPSRVDGDIKREVPYRERLTYMTDLEGENPFAYLRSLAPRTHEYVALMKEKLRLEQVLSRGGWGAGVPAGKLEPGQSGARVVALRDRLIAMGYLTPTATARYDSAVEAAVQRFQRAHGLEADGIAGDGTIKALNTPVTQRLQSVIVAMERERWFNTERGARHILVNLTDFKARIYDKGSLIFETRSVIGKNTSDRRTPEFSDVMEFMVINPSWYVPRSIIAKEYLPALKRNPNAVRHLEITDRRGRKVNRGAVNFAAYSSRNFPFAMRQPPSKSNALGLVKFMFPNKYNIYLHDTPQKALFQREVRAYSHGCVRLHQPFDFAYALLAAQEADPKAYFQRILRSGSETRVNLEQPVPVHLIYRTAFTNPRGQAEYRRDIYGRDGRIWRALAKAGVALPGVQG